METEYFVREDGRTVEKTTQKVVWSKVLQRDFMVFHEGASNEELKTFDESEFVESEGVEVVREKVLPTPEEIAEERKAIKEYNIWYYNEYGIWPWEKCNDFEFGPGS